MNRIVRAVGEPTDEAANAGFGMLVRKPQATAARRRAGEQLPLQRDETRLKVAQTSPR